MASLTRYSNAGTSPDLPEQEVVRWGNLQLQNLDRLFGRDKLFLGIIVNLVCEVDVPD